MRLQLRSSLVKPAKKVIGKQRLTVLVNVSFPAPNFGAIAKRLCNGLQIRLARFDSGSRLQKVCGNSSVGRAQPCQG